MRLLIFVKLGVMNFLALDLYYLRLVFRLIVRFYIAFLLMLAGRLVMKLIYLLIMLHMGAIIVLLNFDLMI